MTYTINDIIKYLNALTSDEYPDPSVEQYYWLIVSPRLHPTKGRGEVWNKILKLRDKVESHSHARGDYKRTPHGPSMWTYRADPTLKAVTEALDNFITVAKDMCEINRIALTPLGVTFFNTIDSYCMETAV